MVEYGCCKCGCGEKTKKYKRQNKKRGQIKGEPTDFLPGHHQKLKITQCIVDGCLNKAKARKLCNIHYLRKWKNGDVFADKPSQRGPIDISGKKYGRWQVIDIANKSNDGEYNWNCICDCGTKKEIRGGSLRSGESKSCGCLAREELKNRIGPKSHNWKGGKRNNHGYVHVRAYGHPNASKDGYVFEHRKIMADHIGRPLERNELVHHKNGIRSDNRIENLELLTSSNHMGVIQCPHCLNKFQLK